MSLLAHQKMLSREIKWLHKRALPFCGAVYHRAAFIRTAHPYCSSCMWRNFIFLPAPSLPVIYVKYGNTLAYFTPSVQAHGKMTKHFTTLHTCRGIILLWDLLLSVATESNVEVVQRQSETRITCSSLWLSSLSWHGLSSVPSAGLMFHFQL